MHQCAAPVDMPVAEVTAASCTAEKNISSCTLQTADCVPAIECVTALDFPTSPILATSFSHEATSRCVLLFGASLSSSVQAFFLIALPISGTQLVRNLSSLVVVVFAGHCLAPLQFAGVSTGIGFVNLTALSIGSGIASAMDTILSQEHGRNSKSKLSGVILQRSIVATFIVYLPIYCLNAFSKPVMALVMAPDLADVVVSFLQLSIFIVVPILLTNNLLKFANLQCHGSIGLVSSLMSLVVLVFMLITFMVVVPIGVAGVVLSISVSRWMMFFAVLHECSTNDSIRSAWPGLDLP